jgi:DNA-binding transcriptional ArsR family regulator
VLSCSTATIVLLVPSTSAASRRTKEWKGAMVEAKSWSAGEEQEAIRSLGRRVRVEAFDLLLREQLTTREISRRLGQKEGRVGYHCRRLLRAGLIEVVGTEERRGAQAKILEPTDLGRYARQWI